MFTGPVALFSGSTNPSPAFLPSATKSDRGTSCTATVSGVSTARSVRITGMLARSASCNTVSHPVVTTGLKAMTSTFCWM